MASALCARCLVVDEDPLVRWSLVRYLESRCREARSVGSGEVALALLREWPADFLIAEAASSEDQQRDSLARYQRLQVRPRIILLTTGETQPLPAELAQFGVVGMIEKPLVFDRLDQLLAGRVRVPGEAAA